ncbi:MAG TPA: AcvB/VirJ family lysyl-phosphatidylglycerol hydrolase [Steroidobacteraceae bacterium]|nr:AcvB/VirJ family lysyl-phosphatidylglycerol hydrolase [Steroidobacteraceae bacterium]
MTKKLLAIAVCVFASLAQVASAREPSTFELPRFGKVTVYPAASEPEEVVLFVSGDGGWNLGVVGMAQALADEGALVAGVDITRYLAALNESQASCSTPDVDFERLGHVLESKYGLKHYREPILVGYSSGATLVYGTLAQAPLGTFVGALSLGFCPDLEVKRPLCKGSGLASEPLPKHNGFNLMPASHIKGRWIALQGAIDQVCLPGPTQAFVAQVPGAELVMLPHVGHGYSVERNWMPQYREAYRRIAARRVAATPVLPPAVSDLPLVEVPAETTGRREFAIILSGDGGWVSIDRDLSTAFAQRGIPVVGWDSLKYFWTARTPDESGRDLGRVIDHYAAAWKRDRVILVGYSQGADTLPFMVNRLSPETRAHVAHTAMLGPGHEAFFEFHVSHWLGTPTGGMPILPEARQLRGNSVACIYGEDDDDSICPELAPGDFSVVKLAGGHHFGGDYENLARIILEGLPQSAMPQSIVRN